MKKIVIAGGGTAGWLTALYVQRVYPSADITLIESQDIGILGAGEGSTPLFVDFLQFLEIPIAGIIKNCQATIKTSIKFTNWNDSGKSFHHPFYAPTSVNGEASWRYESGYEQEITNFAHLAGASYGHSFEDYSLLQKTGENCLVPFIEYRDGKNFESHGYYSLHFDARLLANYLKSIALSRGLKHKEGLIQEIISDEEQYITGLKIQDEVVNCDFVFDCTGLHRLIIGKHYKTLWKSHSKHLPAKKALPFFLAITEDIPPYTEAIAMKYGWIWKIPLQHRYGCGYVFDSNYISEKEAAEEIETYLGFEPEYPRADKGAFKFSAGSFEKTWIKNSLSVGLSSGFIEPLEATSITQAILVLQKFMADKGNLDTRNEKIKARFNELFLAQTQETVDYVSMHYLTKRTDTDFWKNFQLNNPPTDKISYLLGVIDGKPLTRRTDFYECSVFDEHVANWIFIGMEQISHDTLAKLAKQYIDEGRRKEYLSLLAKDNILIPRFIKHRNFLDKLASYV